MMPMSTDPTPLAQRLLRAAMQEPWEADRTREEVACSAVVAVLRELADDFTNPDGEWIAIPPPVLLRLADSIEKGENIQDG